MIDRMRSRLTFHCDGKPLAGRIVILTGVGRSGTTILGNILGSLANVEYEFEPWIFHTVPPFHARREIPQRVAEEILRGFANEALTCDLLGRYVNLRPKDDTRVWLRISPEELLWRWHAVNDRNDVKKISLERGSTLLIKVTNLLAFYDLVCAAYPQAKIIHIVRHPFDVAKSVEKKRWVNLETLRTLEGLPIKQEFLDNGKSTMVPWWVQQEDLEDFLRATEFERGLYYWWYLIHQGDRKAKVLGLDASERYLEVRYEGLLAEPQKTVEKIAAFMGVRFTPSTEVLVKTVRSHELGTPKEYPSIERMCTRWQERLAAAMERFGYSLPNQRVAVPRQ